MLARPPDVELCVSKRPRRAGDKLPRARATRAEPLKVALNRNERIDAHVTHCGGASSNARRGLAPLPQNVAWKEEMRTTVMMASMALGVLPFVAVAQSTDVGGGLAERWCMGCHVVETGPGDVASDGVPTFPAVAAKPSTTAESSSCTSPRPTRIFRTFPSAARSATRWSPTS